MEFEAVQHKFEFDDLTSSIEAYSSPTLDFSILPTYCPVKRFWHAIKVLIYA